RLLGHLGVLIAAAVAAPDLRLSALPLQTASERAQTLREWNDTGSDLPAPAALQAPFEAWAAAVPERPAVQFGDRTLTYGELDGQANRLAARLSALGVGVETRVALALPRSPELIVAILAVVKASGAYVPLDPAYPQERLAFMLADSRAEALLLPAGAAVPEWAGAVRVVRPDGATEGETDDEHGVTAARPAPHPESLAYVIYTSGSTGRPKGAAIPHRAIANTMRAFAPFALNRDDRVLQFASPSFDASLLEILPAFSVGACLVLSERETAASPDLGRELERLRITVAIATPSALAVVPEGAYPDLRALLCAAEALPVDLVRRWAPGRELWNIYGPTEAAIFATTWRNGVTKVSLPPPIGRPIAGMRGYVVDAGLAPCPIGIPGELLLGGPGLGRGYLDRAEQTAQAFVPDPFSAAPGERLYRTGDRVRTLPTGDLEFQGRIDQQVKVRGFRIELGEVETALLAHPAVREAAAGVQKDPRGDRLVACVVLAAGDDVGPLRDFLRRRLPDAMVPSLIVARASLPKSGSGKLDRRALFASGATLEPAAAHTFVPPRTPVEAILAEVWAEVLGLGERRVSRDDGFFELGGHSLLATQVGHRLREIFGVDLPLARLFESPTLADLAREVDAARRAEVGLAPDDLGEPIVPVPRDRPLPASLYQQWMWELQGEPVSAKFNIPSPLLLEGPLDLGALSRALAEIARRHETLRTRFVMQGGELVQIVAPPGDWHLPIVDLSGLADARRREQTRELADRDALAPFDLERGPVFRAVALVLGCDEHAVLLNLHHIVSDGWSLAVLQAEVSVLYAAFVSGRPSPLPPLAVQYADFAVWQRRTLKGPELERQVEAWRRRLAGRPPLLEVPGDRPRPEELDPASFRDDLTLVGEPALRVQGFARASGCTTAMVLLAAIDALLHRYTGRTDLIVNTVFSARDRPALAGLIGFFMNTVPLRVDLSGTPTFRELLWRVRADVLDAYGRQDLPFPRLLAALFPGQTLQRTLLSRVLFNMLSFEGAPAGGEGDGLPLTVTPFAQADEPAKNDLTLTAREGEGFLEVNVVGATDILLPESVVHIRQDLETLLLQAVAAPDTPIDQLLPTLHHRPALPGPEWRGERSG
ncbi:MAG TPA: amino acid adenylation domain-containing protein, partial [Thermoanaerobaculia bacterium]